MHTQCPAYVGRLHCILHLRVSLYIGVWRGTEVRRCVGWAVKLVLISQKLSDTETGMHSNQLCSLIHEVEPSMKCTQLCRLYTVLNAFYCVLDTLIMKSKESSGT